VRWLLGRQEAASNRQGQSLLLVGGHFWLPVGLVVASLMFGVITSACGGSDGDLVIYSGRTRDLVHPLLEDFSRDTGVKIRVRYGDSAELASTILEEGNNSPADVFFSQDAGALGALADEGKLQQLPEPLLSKVDESFRSHDGVWVGVSGRSRVVVYNPDKLREQDLPASVMDLADPRWRGRLGWAPTNASFQAFVTALRVSRGEETARAWLNAMKSNGIRSYPNNIAIVQAVAAGELDAGLVNHYYLYPFLAEHGEGYKARNYFFKGGDIGALLNVAGAGILTSSNNSDEARRFIEYLLDRHAQEYFANATYEYPLADDVPISSDIPPLASLQPPSMDLSRLDDLAGTLKLLQETGVLP
jgi:iron(III) transport system substrate-binding protein